jgi:hypothetical protein
MRLSVVVNHGSTLELRTTLGAERGAKAAADAGNNMVGIVVVLSGSNAKWIAEMEWKGKEKDESKRNNDLWRSRRGI